MRYMSYIPWDYHSFWTLNVSGQRIENYLIRRFRLDCGIRSREAIKSRRFLSSSFRYVAQKRWVILVFVGCLFCDLAWYEQIGSWFQIWKNSWLGLISPRADANTVASQKQESAKLSFNILKRLRLHGLHVLTNPKVFLSDPVPGWCYTSTFWPPAFSTFCRECRTFGKCSL